jgi:hypothetical protein
MLGLSRIGPIRETAGMIGLVDGAGVEGAFVMTSVSPIARTDTHAPW